GSSITNAGRALANCLVREPSLLPLIIIFGPVPVRLLLCQGKIYITTGTGSGLPATASWAITVPINWIFAGGDYEKRRCLNRFLVLAAGMDTLMTVKHLTHRLFYMITMEFR